MNRLLAVLLGLCLLGPVACDRRPAVPTADTNADPAVLDALLHSMHQRLDLMHTVARVKWNAQAPILDPEREKALLQDVVARGQSYHLDAEVTRAFFSAQMEAAKLIQEEDFQRWRMARQPPFADLPDLATLRQQIDVLNRELLAALAPVRLLLDTTEGQKRLDGRVTVLFADYPVPVRDTALRPLRR
jgi:chorismate mutase-like protein